MNPDLARKKELFLKAVRLPKAEQVAFLSRECGADQDLLRELEKLLALGEAGTDVLDRDAAKLMGVESTRPDDTWSEVVERLAEYTPQQSRYTLKGEVARGGMGAILEAFDESLRRTLAMKVILRPEQPAGPEDEAGAGVDQTSFGRFLDEAQVTAQLDHPGIVPVHELGVDDKGQVYFTMKMVQGRDLRAVFELVKTGAEGWNPTRALNVILRVCEAMAFAHSRDVVHRDLKPANIMVGEFGETYVMDWGLARVMDRRDSRDLRIRETTRPAQRIETERGDLAASSPDSPLVTMDGHVIGTPAYMAPEQAAGHLDEVGPPSDIYAMGCILYQLLTGNMPYSHGEARVSPLEILREVEQGPPQPIHLQNRSVPGELVAICDKAMARRRSDRYGSMSDLAGDLRAYLEQRVVSAYESGAFAELKKWVLRNRALTATVAAAVAVLAVVLAWSFSRIRAERDVAQEQEAQATARKAEFDLLSGVVNLEQALETEKELYPAIPERIPAMVAWLEHEATRLESLKPALLRTIADLQQRALPWSATEQEQDRRTHPEFSRLQPLETQVAVLRRAHRVRESGRPEPEVALPEELADADPNQLFEYSFKRATDQETRRRIFGMEAQALAAARHGLLLQKQGKASPRDHSPQLDALAWALFANGRDQEALEANQQAIDLAPPQIRHLFVESRESLEARIATAERDLADLEAELADLDGRLGQRRTYRFELESQSFLHDTLLKLLTGIGSFDAVQRAGVEARLSFAGKIELLTTDHPGAVESWEDAREAIRAADGVVASELYAGHPIHLSPQLGLVPIGMNPVTGLWEFYDLRSATDLGAGDDPATVEIPGFAEDGTIEVGEGTGIVFVLIPGGTFRMGAQQDDERAPNHDPHAEDLESPVQEVTLAPFFLARHELTMAQWRRLSDGGVPSWHQVGLEYSADLVPIGWTHPVNQVTWDECAELMRRSNLTLPTEAQWEYAARGGTTTIWWSGETAASLAGTANVLDLRYYEEDPSWGEPLGSFNDSFASISPVASFLANPFGLHDTAGNVFEWCRDERVDYAGPVGSGDGLRGGEDLLDGIRPIRGGACDKDATFARSAARQKSPPGRRMNILGLRPARAVE